MVADLSLLKLTAGDGTLRFGVHARPGAKKSRIVGVREGALDVRIGVPPVDGAANRELLTALARALSVSRAELRIVRGETGRTKLVEVRSLPEHELRARLAAAIAAEA